jgi:hypothetical protein
LILYPTAEKLNFDSMKKIEERAISQQSLIMDFQVGSKNSGFK